VIRAESNLYTVMDAGETLRCRPRGRLRRLGQKVLVGDEVRFTVTAHGEGAIEEVLPRRNQLTRPPVTNVDQAVVVLSGREPEASLLTVDRLLVQALHEGLEVLLCLNKIDLLARGEEERWLGPYRAAGFPSCATSATTGAGLECMQAALRGRVSVFAGESGVGKSTLLNALVPALSLRTGRVSPKTGRGRHTTRHVELVPVAPDGLVADTPGLHAVGTPDIAPAELGSFWPELAALAAGCRFRGCLHREEPGCRVKEALAVGALDRGRYQRYLTLLQEVEQAYRRY